MKNQYFSCFPLFLLRSLVYNIGMENKLSREQLNTLDSGILVGMLLQQQEREERLYAEIANLTKKVEYLTEQLALANTRAFAPSTEKNLVALDEDQMNFFNEFEAEIAGKVISEPKIKEVVVAAHTRRKKTGKRAEDLSAFPKKEISHELSEEQLASEFPNGYNRLPDEVYSKLEFHPATFEVLEHHIAVYKDKRSERILKAPHPVEMLDKSIATPSLVAAILNSKYVNAQPLYRQEQAFANMDLNLSRQNMANWAITLSERYLSLVYDRLKAEIIKTPVIHADETPVMVTKDGREGMHNNYMWVYRTGTMCKAKPAILYEYQRTRKAEAPEEFLKGFSGKLVCDGYQVYHSIEDTRSGDITVAGCWAHARRPFAEVVKALGKEKAEGTIAYEALAQISNIYYVDNTLKELPPAMRKKKRKLLVKPLVDSFFEWVKECAAQIPPSSKTAKGLAYCINQEKYLRTFLTDPAVPLDNNAAEQAIRSFCVGKKNWKLIDTINGAEASAVIYSLVETAKANNLKCYEYFKHLLTEIPKHMKDTSLDFLEDLLPWSDAIPEECKKKIVK